MQTTNGLAATFRSRTRLMGCATAIVLLSLAWALLGSATAQASPVKETYLALGDSLAFGYSQQLFNENFPLEPPTAFEAGYANDYWDLHHPERKGIQLTNDGCPGETTDSMIGNGPLGAAVDPTGENPCAYHRLGFPLHHEYGGTRSQLESALESIAVDAAAGTPVTTVTLDIGANDELHMIAKCEAEVGAEVEKGEIPFSEAAAAVEKCVLEAVPGLFSHILTNVATTLFVLRDGSAFGGVNYAGKIVVQGGYNPFGNVFGEGELRAGTNALVAELNKLEGELVAANTPERPFRACYANPQFKFNPQDKQEPERLQKYTNMANFTEFEGKKNGPDIHPTPEGYLQLAKIMKADCE